MIANLWSQTDPRWGSKIMVAIDSAPLYVARWGCMYTSFLMGAKNYAIEDDPGVGVEKFKANGVFDEAGNFIQQNITRIYPSVRHKERVYTTVTPDPRYSRMGIDEAIARIHRFVESGQIVLVNVDLVGQDKNADHWVLVKDFKQGDLFIHDPAFGDAVWFTSRYGDPRFGVYGYSAFIGQPVDSQPTTAYLGDVMAKLSEAKAELSEAQANMDLVETKKIVGQAQQNIREALDSLTG